MTINATVQLKGPFACQEGLSFEKFGELLNHLKQDQAYGRTPVMDGMGETFHLILYEDNSWRISTPQLELFPTESAHTLT